MMPDNFIREHRFVTLNLCPRINDYIVTWLHTESQ